MFCKYAAPHTDDVYQHKSAGGYEAQVYRTVLGDLGLSRPTFYGAYEDAATAQTWVVLQHLDGCTHVKQAPSVPSAMGLAARWIGQFQAASRRHHSSEAVRFLRRYDAEYYRGWASRTASFAGHWHQFHTWLATVCERFGELAEKLLMPQPTIIHGEYYPKNVLVRDAEIYPVDWESAAVAAGEIDLAMLTDGWPDSIADLCELEYQRSLWPAGTPAEFTDRLSAARVYVHLRWLGDRPEWIANEKCVWRFDPLRSACQRLGVI